MKHLQKYTKAHISFALVYSHSERIPIIIIIIIIDIYYYNFTH